MINDCNLYYIIFNYFDFKDKHTFKRIDKKTNSIKITNLYDIDQKYCQNINQENLKNYPYVKKLKLDGNVRVRSLNHLTYLEEFYIFLSRLNDDGINELTNLKKLTIEGLLSTLYIHKLVNLEYLHICSHWPANKNGTNKINMDDEIKRLTNLNFLCVNNNHHITNINSLTNLEILYACGDSGLSNNGIEKLTKLKELYIDKNLKINIFDHFKCLTKLSIHGHDYETFAKYYETIDHIYVNDEHCSRYFKEKKLK